MEPTRAATQPPSPSLLFADAARRLGAAARAAGLDVPAFRSPPRVRGAPRSIRRYPGGAVVSVQLRGRPFAAVTEDMVEGVLVANRLRGEHADRVRRALADVLRAPGRGTVSPVPERGTQAA